MLLRFSAATHARAKYYFRARWQKRLLPMAVACRQRSDPYPYLKSREAYCTGAGACSIFGAYRRSSDCLCTRARIVQWTPLRDAIWASIQELEFPRVAGDGEPPCNGAVGDSLDSSRRRPTPRPPKFG